MNRCQALRVQPSYVLAGTGRRQLAQEARQIAGVSSRFLLALPAGSSERSTGALEFGHAEIGGPRRSIGEVKAIDFPRPAIVVEGVKFFGQAVVAGQHGPAFAGGQILGHLEAEAAGRAPRSDAAAPPLGQMGLAGVLDHRQVVFLGHGENAVMSDALPPMWTGMMAAVRSVMAASIFLGSIRNVSGSTSTNTGNAKCIMIEVTLAMKV